MKETRGELFELIERHINLSQIQNLEECVNGKEIKKTIGYVIRQSKIDLLTLKIQKYKLQLKII